MKKNLDDILPQEFVKKRTQEYELKELQKKKTTYWDFLGDLGFYLGFEAVQAVLNDYIEIEQARALLSGAKRAYYGTVYDQGVAALAGARGRYKGSEFDRLMKFYTKEM